MEKFLSWTSQIDKNVYHTVWVIVLTTFTTEIVQFARLLEMFLWNFEDITFSLLCIVIFMLLSTSTIIIYSKLWHSVILIHLYITISRVYNVYICFISIYTFSFHYIVNYIVKISLSLVNYIVKISLQFLECVICLYSCTYSQSF